MDIAHQKSLRELLDIEEVPGRDLFIVAQFLDPTEAHFACGCLVAAGIPAVVADNNLAQAYTLISCAMGGVRVLAPQEHLEQARLVLAALARGELALDDDVDVGPPEQAS